LYVKKRFLEITPLLLVTSEIWQVLYCYL